MQRTFLFLFAVTLVVFGFDKGFHFECKDDCEPIDCGSGASGGKDVPGFPSLWVIVTKSAPYWGGASGDNCTEDISGTKLACTVTWVDQSVYTLFTLSYDATRTVVSATLEKVDKVIHTFPSCRFLPSVITK